MALADDFPRSDTGMPATPNLTVDATFVVLTGPVKKSGLGRP
ncbi:hypothetical protein [Salinicola avicenniae]|nr:MULTISPECIES: hypothetical protein [unclassified Salinicola]